MEHVDLDVVAVEHESGETLGLDPHDLRDGLEAFGGTPFGAVPLANRLVGHEQTDHAVARLSAPDTELVEVLVLPQLIGTETHRVESAEVVLRLIGVRTDRLQCGDILVGASTGEVLAGAAIQSLAEESVVFGSIDDAPVYYATSPGGGATGDVWVWRWAAGEVPQLSDRSVADVSGDIWAVEREDRIDFENADGTVLSSVHASYGDRTAFGSGLSPGGRFWYAPAYDLIVETATGGSSQDRTRFQAALRLGRA